MQQRVCSYKSPCHRERHTCLLWRVQRNPWHSCRNHNPWSLIDWPSFPIGLDNQLRDQFRHQTSSWQWNSHSRHFCGPYWFLHYLFTTMLGSFNCTMGHWAPNFHLYKVWLCGHAYHRCSCKWLSFGCRTKMLFHRVHFNRSNLGIFTKLSPTSKHRRLQFCSRTYRFE